MESYTKSEVILNKHVKCFVRPQEALKSDNPHFYHIKAPNKVYGLHGRSNSGHFNNLPIPFYKSPAYIAHYYTQSEETYTKRKLSVPRDDTGEMRSGDVKTIHNSSNDIDNLHPKSRYSENIKRFLEYYK
jgi:hypothetical protein